MDEIAAEEGVDDEAEEVDVVTVSLPLVLVVNVEDDVCSPVAVRVAVVT